jgi:transcriptional regulator with XRE-family HTH domain
VKGLLGERLATLRKNKGLTQEELAPILNITRSALSLYELNKRDPDTNTLKRIADYFNVTTDYLLGRSDVPSPPKNGKQNQNTLKKDVNQYIDTIKHIEDLLKSNDISQDEKEMMFRDISMLFWKSKEFNKTRK